VVGGYAGFNKPCRAKFYRSMPADVMLRDVLTDGGENYSRTSTPRQQLPFWTRPVTSVAEAFEELVESVGCVWRVLDGGDTWVGEETWPEAQAPDALVLDEDPAERTAVVADGGSIRPGQVFDGRHVSRVMLTFSPGAVRTTLWFQSPDDEGDRMRAALQKIVRQMTRTMDFLAKVPAKVVSQNGDGSLELRPVEPRWPGLSRIPIRYGVPGVRAKVKPGSIVAVEFENGDPAKPVATVWADESVADLTIKADRLVIDALDIDAQHGRPVARVGDLVSTLVSPVGTVAMGQIVTGNNTNRG
jgi:hypothetical protein